MQPFLRKLTLTMHITSSVGWLGAVTGFLALAIAGLMSPDNQVVRSAYLSMKLMACFVIIPFCFTSLLTGIIQCLGTPWGLFKHYWIVVKLLLTLVATVILLLHMKSISYAGELAAKEELRGSNYRGLRIQLVADAGGALVVLLVNTILSVYKPWGKTKYLLRSSKGPDNQVVASGYENQKPWRLYLLILFLGFLVLLSVVKHLMEGGFKGP